MTDEKKRIQVFPSARALEILGIDADERGLGGEVTHAIECWAEAMRRASAEVADVLTRQEWCLLADVLNGTWTLDRTWTGQVLAIEVADAQRLDGVGGKWLATEGDPATRVEYLTERLSAMTFEQAQAVVLVVRWFWSHHEKIDIEKDEWWMMAFRLKK